ncbi:WecB/TagA/CpsF family glycosyltransferase [Spongiactinospora sp. TRM90649]|uniref:WecB/TagA/CpsF family glycosyltransferase n=1 Tax=Spongiactinospora sp. TRM90649 TaxID=3031114 RepID=UPI0023F7CA77|nr:WecB/TagA/CpsF family glycosyltransferase [Spongiactinospora sp. TRM90649]MDF5754807.1 WecB/TagA/CpsF family glycosyltransferase [Spongiactinospora sp. TRM90649]
MPHVPEDGRVIVGRVAFDPLTEGEVVDRVVAALRAGQGGHIITPNVDICRATRRDSEIAALVASADIVVADGMPLVWASKLLGTPVPGRVTGADLIWSLSAAAAREGAPVFLLGGPPGVAERAGAALAARAPGLIVAGTFAPPFGFESVAAEQVRIRSELLAADPRLVFVGLGFPRQDRLIVELREILPGAWFVGCGAAVAFAAGTMRRAPAWMRGAGLEWMHRLITEPIRLARRYLIDDLPFATGLLITSAIRRRH